MWQHAWKNTFILAGSGRSTFVGRDGERRWTSIGTKSLSYSGSDWGDILNHDHITKVSYRRVPCYKTRNCKPPTKHLLHPEQSTYYSCQWRHMTQNVLKASNSFDSSNNNIWSHLHSFSKKSSALSRTRYFGVRCFYHLKHLHIFSNVCEPRLLHLLLNINTVHMHCSWIRYCILLTQAHMERQKHVNTLSWLI